MNSANATEQEMKYLIDKYSGDNINQLFSTGLLSHPFLASGPRQHMFSVHYQQHIMLKDPETPRCFTGWENQFGKYLNSFYKADKRYEVIAKIVRHSSFPQMSYLLVVKEVGRKFYDTIRVNHYKKLSDKHGFLRPFTKMDDKTKGSIIDVDDLVYRAQSLDQWGNYRYGRNYKVIPLLIPEVKDDSVVMSKSAADATKFDLVTKTEVDYNKNTIGLNIYGDLNDYKMFPNVGERVNDKGILLATRNMNKKNLSADFTDMALTNMYYTDNKFAGGGMVVDIDIRVNDIDELRSDPHRYQLFDLYQDQLRYNQEIVDILQPIVNDTSNHISPKLEQELFNARNYISPNVKYSSNTGNFEFAHITIFTAEERSLTEAMKTTNRCGGKAVIGKIWPDENMPVNSDGTRAEVIISANGIIGRANPDQLLEQTINYTSDQILRMMMGKSTEDAIKLEETYLSYMSPKWGQYFKDVHAVKSKSELEQELKDLYASKHGIYMYDPPANGAIGWKKVKTLGKKYGIKVSKVKMCRTYKVSEEIADMYDMKENIDQVKDFMDKYTFDVKTKELKKKNGKKTEKVIEKHDNELSALDIKENVLNPLGLKLNDYKNNKWTDDFVWSDNEVSELDIENNESTELADYINTIQALEGVFDQEDFLANQLKDSYFDTTKSRVYRKDKNTLVREFTSKYPVIIGDVYMMILKQLPDDGFSSRSLGSITPLGLPNKSMKKSEIGKPYGDTANQFSEMDNTDLKNLVDPIMVSRFYAVQSTSPEMRTECAKMLLFEDPTKLHDLPYTNEEIACDTVPAKILNQYFGAIGLELGDTDEEDPYEFLDGVNYRSIPELMKKVGITPENNPFNKNGKSA